MWVDGHDAAAIAVAIERARHSDRPTLIACKTTIGYGAPNKAGKASAHGEPLGAEEIKAARDKLGWAKRSVRGAGRGARGVARRRCARQRGAQGLGAARSEARCRASGHASAIRWMPRRAKALAEAVAEIKAEFAASPPKIATRVASQKVLEKLVPGAAVPDRRLGGPHRLQRHAHQAAHDRCPGELRRQLHPLRRARARHGGGHERHGAARRHRALRRHVPGVHRLLPSRDPPLGDHGAAGRLRHDARLHRARRGRADAPAHRASGQPARHAEPQRVPPGRPDRDGGVLGAGADCRRRRPRSWL